MTKAKEPQPIQATARLKKMDVVKNDVKMAFDGVKLSARQAEKMKNIIDNGGCVILTVLEEQQGMPGMEEDGE